jgi:hypothetical protein
MRLTWNRHTRTLAGGATTALACGLFLGGAMRPELGDDGRPAGPQTIAGWAGVRSTGPFDPGPSAANYGGQVPDYVMGTDSKRSMAWPETRAAVAERAPPMAVYEVAPPAPEDGAWAPPMVQADDQDAAPTPQTAYRSQGGGTARAMAGDDPETSPVATTG